MTLWSQRQPTALRALWLTNASTLTLDRGSFAIVENGSFGGEGLLDPIHPGEKRLLSYAADQAVRVTAVRLQQQLAASTASRSAKASSAKPPPTSTERTYDVRNAAPDPRTVILEHPLRKGWELTSETEARRNHPHRRPLSHPRPTRPDRAPPSRRAPHKLRLLPPQSTAPRTSSSLLLRDAKANPADPGRPPARLRRPPRRPSPRRPDPRPRSRDRLHHR